MKQIFFFLAFLGLSLSLSAQVSFKTGDVELEGDLNKINAKAKIDFGKFKVEMAGTYNIEERKLEHMHVGMEMEPAEIYIALEVAKISKRPIDDVLAAYEKHKDKGWGFIAKQLGIKPGSDEFHALKNGAHKQGSENDQSSKKKEKKKNKNKGKGKNKK